MQEELLALPATLTTSDGPEDYWLLVHPDADLAQAFAKARTLENCLREQELVRAVFLPNHVAPATGLLWGEEPLTQAIGAEHLTEAILTALEKQKPFAIPTRELPDPGNTFEVLRTEHALWLDVSPQHPEGVNIEFYGYPKYGSGRFYAEVPNEVVEEILARFPTEEAR
ncbi:hypothetical protein Ocepr_2276 (plasmid) [Oceanithermus profundus DSM 14977]|uniref:Uncharacterized protein n=1 Tax=Oceanithermus profundus (strain DSM 14977 / NBRC 100410 / VKM B-2274 / 506) TaxID=670487 RepID=E4UAT9_OCEP5|nr:hypothetical protein [Oceanithermus profundus]ADR37724.1 hypothetical protein Ocepr_2276 [Oceanithermus profundus DSM 14977]